MNKQIWVKSSYSGGSSGNCVEVADYGSTVLVRDTKDHGGAVLRFSPAAWRKFSDRVKAARSLAPAPKQRYRGRSHVFRLRVALCMPGVSREH
jgi:hypothetical protein